MSEADWMPSPVGERDLDQRRRQVVWHDWIALTATPLAMVAITVALAYGIGVIVSPLAGVLAAVVLMGIDFLIASRIDQRRDALVAACHEPDRAIQEDFGVGRGWFVDLIVHRGTAPIGTDRGVMWVEDGRLYFSGHRTSFALTPDLADDARHQMAIPGLRHEILIHVRHPTASLSISIHPISVNVGEQSDLLPGLAAWSKGPATGGQMPPAVPGPGVVPRGVLFRRATVATLYWAGMGAFLAVLPSVEARLWFGVVGILVGALALRLWPVVPLWRAWADRQRPDRDKL